MYCIKCGYAVEKGESFCKRCGSPVNMEDKVFYVVEGTIPSDQSQPYLRQLQYGTIIEEELHKENVDKKTIFIRIGIITVLSLIFCINMIMIIMDILT